ncbi:MAG: VWA domain-containing protein, partial [Planctomycetota bacterium]
MDLNEQQLVREFEFAGAPEGWLRLIALAAAAVAIYVVLWLYRRESRGSAGVRLRMVLAGLRLAALALLALIALDPILATIHIRKIPACVIVLADASSSMQIADAVGAGGQAVRSRADVVRDLLGRNGGEWLRRLARSNELRLYTFGDQPERLSAPTENDEAHETAASQPAWAWTATQPASDLGAAFVRALDEARGRPIAAIIVLSDGAVNRGASVDALAAAARAVRAPVFGVGVGAAQEPPNLRVARFTAPRTGALGDPIELSGRIESHGLPPQAVTVELTRQSAQGDGRDAEQVIETRELDVGEDAPGDVAFVVPADDAGEFVYRLRARGGAAEAVESDNTRRAVVRVLDESLRVLLVAGHATYDYRNVTQLFERDRTIDLSCWLQSADENALRDGDTPLDHLPREPSELFAYDVVLLMDPDPSELDSSWALAVRRFVDEFRGGVLYQAGPQYATRFLRDERVTDLLSILPVARDPDADVRISEMGAYRTKAAPFLVPDDAWGHPLAQLHRDERINRRVWSALPGVYWYLPVLRERPLASVLLRHGGRAHAGRYGQPVLLAVQPFGGGRTAFLAFDSTWRWRATAETYFNHFWVQLARYLGQARRAGAGKRGAIELARDDARVGDILRIEAQVLDEKFLPWRAEQIAGEIRADDGVRRPLRFTPIAARPGWFETRALVDWTGPALIAVPLPNASDDEALTRYVYIDEPDLEFQSLRARPDL